MSQFLNHSLISAPLSKPSQWVYFLHGIYGRGGNLRTLARNFVKECPGVGVGLVDLRMHGKSQGFAPPHNLKAASKDVVRLLKHNHDAKDILGIVGHSFGGKVALECSRLWSGGSIKIVVLDSSPSKNSGQIQDTNHTVIKFLQDLKNMPPQFFSREEFENWMLAKEYPQGIVQWLAMNLVNEGNTFSFALKHEAMHSLLASYFDSDLWDQVGDHTFLMAAGKNSSLSIEDLKRFRECIGDRVQLVENAGHWLHVEAPSEVLTFLSATFG